jgi:hypothetical protein
MPGYRDLIGTVITDVTTLNDAFENQSGLVLHTATRTLYIVAEGDETHVYWAQPLGHRASQVSK